MRAYKVMQDIRHCNTTDLSKQQKSALDKICQWVKDDEPDRPIFFLDGYAGTGKTGLVIELGQQLPNIQYAALTGKAASVLRHRGAENAVTLHSLLYGAPTIKKSKTGDEILDWRRREGKIDADLIVADECSMIDERLGRDLLATEIKVLITGDREQLPPVLGQAYFTRPHFTLTEIHRQAANSQPLQLATAIRAGQHIRPQRFDLDVVLDADIVIVALNRTRRHLNHLIRMSKGIADRRDKDAPMVGDRIVCLRNNRDTGVFNGSLWTIRSLAPVSIAELMPFEIEDKVKRSKIANLAGLLHWLTIEDEIGTVAKVMAHEDCFYGIKANEIERYYDVFDFSYALTAHKAQGSEWDRVVVIDETNSRGFGYIIGDLSLAEFKRRWLYTAVTRAKQHVTLMEAPK